MNALTPPPTAVPNASYEETRFNALQHGVLSRHAVLPWEDRAEYQAHLLDALRSESTRHKVRPKSISRRGTGRHHLAQAPIAIGRGFDLPGAAAQGRHQHLRSGPSRRRRAPTIGRQAQGQG